MKIFVRADGSHSIGTGHIFRTLVLAERMKYLDNEVIYLCRELPAQLRKRVEDTGFRVFDVPNRIDFQHEAGFLCEAIVKEKPQWVIVDHYDIKEDYYLKLREKGVKLFAIDDINHTRFPVDILFNQNSNATALNYFCLENTTKLLGPKYALVRDIYRRKRKDAKIRDSLRKVLIFMGGADPNNQTLKVIKGISNLKDISADIVLGPAFNDRNLIEQELKKLSLGWAIHENIDDLASLMLKADIAFGSGGSSSWEMATMKLPMILMPIAENQIGVAEGLQNSGAAINLGWFENVNENDIANALSKIDTDTLKNMSENAARLCDGSGVDLIIKAIGQYSLTRAV